MRAAVFENFGEPDQVLSIRDVPMPEPGPGQVRVRMIASPVNPSDLLVVRGRYGVLPTLPSTPGFEGVGIVEKAGPGLIGRILVGRRVAAINGDGGNWAEYAVIPAVQAIPVPSALDDVQVASLFVNPATVLAMVRYELAVPKGAWLLQSAAGSSLGRMVIKLGRRDGFKTLNVVRRREAMQEIRDLGGDAVICTEDGPIPEQVMSVTGGRGVAHALDPVGGDTGTGVFESLSSDATMIVYGTLTGEPIRIDSRRMIAGKRVVRGFWLGHWMRSRSKVAAVPFFFEVIKLIREGILATEPGASLPLDSIREAVREAEVTGRKGKVLLKIAPGR